MHLLVHALFTTGHVLMIMNDDDNHFNHLHFHQACARLATAALLVKHKDT